MAPNGAKKQPNIKALTGPKLGKITLFAEKNQTDPSPLKPPIIPTVSGDKPAAEI
jgi:hypothetical protein